MLHVKTFATKKHILNVKIPADTYIGNQNVIIGHQGCQIFPGTKYQNGGKYTK
jgi:hypothetical protein